MKHLAITNAIIAAIVVTSAAGQTAPPNVANASVAGGAKVSEMLSGVLAILPDQSGTLMVDGVDDGKAAASNVLAVKLPAGQHFAEFRDGNGLKVWEKIVSIPAGSQVAEKIDLHSGTAATQVSAAPLLPLNQGGVGQHEDFLNMNDDASAIEHSVEAYLNRNGLHAQLVSGNNGQIHYVQLGFRGNGGQPNITVRISAAEQGSNTLGRWRPLLLTLGTDLRIPKSDALYAALDEANKTSHCAWFLDTDNGVMCRSWPTLPNPQYSVPIDEILTLIRFINGDWLRVYPQLNNLLK